MSRIVDEESYIVSTDIGFVQVRLKKVVDVDMEDVVQDKAISQARILQFIAAGKQVDQSKPTGARTLKSKYLNNTIEL